MNKNRTLSLSITGFSMVLLILDTKIALTAALQGIDLCLKAVIPSLFPFYFLSAIINDRLLGTNIKIARPLACLCKMPEGSASILLLGLLGGYPVGASCICEAYRNGTLKWSQATRMLAFCNNAGPAFLFGMLSAVIVDRTALWVLWFIHILSALLVGMFMPDTDRAAVTVTHIPTLTPSQAMHNSVRNMGSVCGWIVLFRIILGFCQRWFLWLLPDSARILLTGILELSNGCLSLGELPCVSQRFLYAALFLSFGGVCVSMQTASVIGKLPLKAYISGKLLQTVISFVLASTAQMILFPEDHMELSVPLLISITLLLFMTLTKKAVAFRRGMRYNGENEC